MARLSNETLAQTISATVKRLETRLKEDEKKRLEHQQLLNQRLSDAQNYEFDLTPVREEFQAQMEHLRQITADIRKDVRNPYLTWKAIAIYLGVMIVTFGMIYFLNSKVQKQRDDAIQEKAIYQNYINSTPQRKADFEEWNK